jgi:2-polyprenyl-3-methyl-5-hydroxy-6-metoxy-1,4-benzoquinol methylase
MIIITHKHLVINGIDLAKHKLILLQILMSLNLRFFNETGFLKAELSEGVTLATGCGVGRFMDIALRYGEKVIGLDYFSSVIATSKNMNNLNHDKNNYILIQGSIYEMPIKNFVIDRIYSIRVLQHMPNRKKQLLRYQMH